MKHYKLNIMPIGPVHIGTGDELLPFSYFIMNIGRQGEEYRCIRYDESRLIQYFDQEQKERFIKLAQKDDFIELRKFFIEAAGKIIVKHNECILSMSEVSREVINLWNDFNNHPKNSFILRPTIASAVTGKALVPYIPGSSIKGALRTAILDALVLVEKRKNLKPEAVKDPFRMLAVSDALFPGKGSRMVGAAYLYNRVKGGVESLKLVYEVLKGSVMCDNDTPSGICSLTIHTELKQQNHFMYEIPDLTEIAKECNNFYLNLFDKEYDQFYKDAPDDVYQGFKAIDNVIKTITDSNEFIIKLGRHSQFEYMTLNDVRKYPGGRNSTISRTLFNHNNLYLPMGWVHIKYEEIP